MGHKYITISKSNTNGGPLRITIVMAPVMRIVLDI